MAITVVIVGHITPHARASPRASPLTFVVTRERIPTGEATATFRTDMRSFASMQFGVPFQIMQSSETRLAGLANIWLLLAVGKQVTFEVVVPGELGRAVGTLMFLGAGRPLAGTAAKTGTGQTQATTSITEP